MVDPNFLVGRRLALVCNWKNIYLEKQERLALNFFFFFLWLWAGHSREGKEREPTSIENLLLPSTVFAYVISPNSPITPEGRHCYPTLKMKKFRRGGKIKMKKLRLQDVKRIPNRKNGSTGIRIQFYLIQRPQTFPPPPSTGLSWTPSFLIYKIKEMSKTISWRPSHILLDGLRGWEEKEETGRGLRH